MDVIVDPQCLQLDAASQAGMEEDRAAKANLKILQAHAARRDHAAPRRITLRFLASPVEVISVDGRILALRVEENVAGLVLRSIGYRTVPIEGVPFDPATSTINSIAGQVVHPNTG